MGMSRGLRARARAAVLVLAGTLAFAGCVVGATTNAGVVANTSATLNGTVSGYGAEQFGTASYWFEYGTTANYDHSTPHGTVGTARGYALPVSARVDGLQPNRTYHYRLCSTDVADGKGLCGSDTAFTTGADRDLVMGDAVINLGPNLFGRATVAAAGGTGYLDGTVDGGGTIPGTPTVPYLPWGGPGAAECLRVDGNVAVVGWSYTDLFGSYTAELLIEDNGATGDRFDIFVGDDGPACAAPDASRIGTGKVGSSGVVSSGDFVVEDN
jgi:hypothetical protein